MRLKQFSHMAFWCAIVGTIVFLVAFYDIVWTTLSAAKSGPLTLLVTKGFRMFMRCFHGRHRILQGLGVLTFLSTILMWYLLIWSAWALIFLTVHGGIIRTFDGQPASVIDIIYFSGYTIFTLGMGDFIPVSAAYRMMVAMSCATGFFLVSITATYLLSATAAIANQREFAGDVSTLGTSSCQIIMNAWNYERGDLHDLEHFLNKHAVYIVRSAQHILLYPIICNFHSVEILYSANVQIAILDELLSIVEYSMQKGVLNHLTVLHLRNAITQYMNVLERLHFLHPAKTEPPIPDLNPLLEKGIHVISMSVIQESNLEHTPHITWSSIEVSKRRKLLKQLVKIHGRQWSEVCI